MNNNFNILTSNKRLALKEFDSGLYYTGYLYWKQNCHNPNKNYKLDRIAGSNGLIYVEWAIRVVRLVRAAAIKEIVRFLCKAVINYHATKPCCETKRHGYNNLNWTRSLKEDTVNFTNLSLYSWHSYVIDHFVNQDIACTATIIWYAGNLLEILACNLIIKKLNNK